MIGFTADLDQRAPPATDVRQPTKALPADGPVAVITHLGAENFPVELTESGARALVEYLRAAASPAGATEVEFSLSSVGGTVNVKATPDWVRAYAASLEDSLSLWIARRDGKHVGQVTQYTRGPDKEIVESRTQYRY